MVYLLLSIVASTAVLIVFRWMQDNGANTRHAITVNYFAASLTGTLFFLPSAAIGSEPWFWPAAFMGLIFYLVFRVMARTAQVNGVAAAGIATKMSVVLPVGVGLLFLGEELNALKIIGLLTGLVAVVLTAGKGKEVNQWKWLALAFLGTGFIDSSLKLFQVWWLTDDEFPALITTIFLFAFTVGAGHHMILPNRKIGFASVRSGVLLGAINFGTVYFILHALATPNWDSSLIFPLNNFGVVAMSTLAGVWIFRERLSAKGWTGLVLAALSILLLYKSG